MTGARGIVSIGAAGVLGPDLIGELAPAAERAGFHTLWVNDTPGGDALAALVAAAARTRTLRLATGVVPVNRRSADTVARAARDLPEGRLTIGIGSGSARTGTLDLVRDAIATLRAQTSARIVVGALGPRMSHLAVTEGDGIVLNWLTPDAAAHQSADLHAVAPRTHVALYVRTALDEPSRARLEDEASRYGRVPAYAANFARLGFGPLQAVLPQPGDDAIAAGVAAYADAVDEVVLRAVTATDDLDAYLAFIERTGPLMTTLS